MAEYNPFRLAPNHPLYWMEEVIVKELGLVTPEHDAEHDKMLSHWNIKHPSSAPLNGFPKMEDNAGKRRFYFTNDRAYHLALHIKYWKDMDMHPKYVERYENEIGSLDDVKVPELHKEDPRRNS